MFYCSSFLKDCVYYSRDLDAVLVIGEEDGERHLIEFLGGGAGISLKDAAGAAGEAGAEDILLGFAPEDPEGCVIENLDTEDFLFVRSGRETIKAWIGSVFRNFPTRNGRLKQGGNGKWYGQKQTRL